jgi:hypothetical protein
MYIDETFHAYCVLAARIALAVRGHLQNSTTCIISFSCSTPGSGSQDQITDADNCVCQKNLPCVCCMECPVLQLDASKRSLVLPIDAALMFLTHSNMAHSRTSVPVQRVVKRSSLCLRPKLFLTANFLILFLPAAPTSGAILHRRHSCHP